MKDEPLNKVTLELDKGKVDELLGADVLLIGGIRWYRDKIVAEALVEYAKKKIKDED